jgi:NADP-dependent 3-hydroxy acid dehydrogenase YdfG
LFKQCVDRFGRVDVLINNASVYNEKSLADATSQEVDAMLDVAIKGSTYASKAALNVMIGQRDGQIMTMLFAGYKQGLGQYRPDKAFTLYHIAKFGQAIVTDMVRREGNDNGIATTSVYLKSVASELDIDEDTSVKGSNHPREVVDKILKVIADPKDEIFILPE